MYFVVVNYVEQYLLRILNLETQISVGSYIVTSRTFSGPQTTVNRRSVKGYQTVKWTYILEFGG